MKKQYVLYMFMFGLLVSACKKNDINSPGSNTNTPGKGTDGKPNHPINTTVPLLINFRINGAACAFDSTTNTYYYPVAINTTLSSYTVSYDTTVVKAIYMDNTRVNNGATSTAALKTNQTVAIKTVSTLNASLNYNLIITGLPIVSLTANTAIADAQVKASFDLVNPDYQSQKSQLEISSNIMINIRGVSARVFPKKSYAVHAVDGSGNQADVSLLGLRDDDDWILDAMYIDQARMRNRVCTDMWNSFNNVPYIANEPTALNGTRGYMTEVFLNNKYLGVYCLTEKLDRKQLQVKKQYGNMYKADDWTSITDFTSVSGSFSNSSATWAGWELEYPNLNDTPAPNWTYLYNIVNFIAKSTDDDFKNNIATKVDINNIVDYYIFMNIINGIDNENKNTFFSFYDSRNAGAFFYSPWDMDSTLGRDFTGSTVPNTLIGPGNNNLFQRLINLNAAGFKGLLKSRWSTLKGNQLSKAIVGSKIEGYRKLLVNTNAFTREQAANNNIGHDLNTETAYMNSWYAAQFDLFDSYINGL